MKINKTKTDWKTHDHSKWLNKHRNGKSYPLCLEIDPANACSLNCQFCCWAKMRNKNADKLSRAKLFDIVNECKQLGIKSLIWTGGGDPLMNYNTIETIVYANELGIRNGMFTNAVLLTPNRSDKLAKNLDWIRFNVGGSNAEFYSESHGVDKKVFDIVCKNIKYFCENTSVYAGIGSIVNKNSFEGIKGLAKLSKKLGLKYFQARMDLFEMGKDSYIDWWFDEVVPFFNDLRTKLEEKGCFEVHCVEKSVIRTTTASRCYSSDVITAIKANGDVAFCKMMRDRPALALGNVYRNTLKEIFDIKRKNKTDVNPRTCPVLCKYCPYRKVNEVMEEALKQRPIKKGLNFLE